MPLDGAGTESMDPLRNNPRSDLPRRGLGGKFSSMLNARSMRGRILMAALICSVAGAGCSDPRPQVASAVATLPEYGATESALFGDSMSGPVFGSQWSRPIANDHRMRE